MPEVADFAAALVHADHGVHRQNQRCRCNRAVAFTQCTKHGQGEGGQGHGDGEDPGVGEQQFHRKRGNGETQQGDEQRAEAALPAIVGLGQGAGDDAEEQRDEQAHLVLVPAPGHAAGERDGHADGVAELVLTPQATQ
ncbi:hypothetical protein D3C79_780230 [compost metagenome]